MKILFPFGMCCAMFLLLFAAFGLLAQTPSQPLGALPLLPRIPQTQEPQSLTLLFTGDIMLDRGVEEHAKGNWAWPFLRIAGALNKADLVFGNLESQISDKGRNVGSIYSFRADPASVQGLIYAGFDVLSVANNHSLDYTQEAFADSTRILREANIAPAADTLIIKEIQNTKIGFLAYSNFPGIARVDWDNMQEVMENIAAAKAKVDILAVSLHAGNEYEPEANEFQKAFSKQAIDQGADLIVGHHSHVVQPFVPHKRKGTDEIGWIAYGLGNFVFDQNFSNETMEGAILKVTIADKKIKEVSLLHTKLTPSYQVYLEQ